MEYLAHCTACKQANGFSRTHFKKKTAQNWFIGVPIFRWRPSAILSINTEAPISSPFVSTDNYMEPIGNL